LGEEWINGVTIDFSPSCIREAIEQDELDSLISERTFHPNDIAYQQMAAALKEIAR
jgi:hypothetical protein